MLRLIFARELDIAAKGNAVSLTGSETLSRFALLMEMLLAGPEMVIAADGWQECSHVQYMKRLPNQPSN
jgi:hypothetical protein